MQQSVDDISIASAYVLRIGVSISVAVMLLGISLSLFRGHLHLSHIHTQRFDYHPRDILDGLRHGEAHSVTDLGIYLLLLTPITRVALSAVIFAFKEKDWLYAGFTAIVLALTLAGLLWLG